MPVISACPKCQKPVTVPAGVESAALVRCPLCAAEYPLCEALPPELIPVVAAPVAVAAPDSAWAVDIVVQSPAASKAKTEADAAKEIEEKNEAAAVAGRVLTAGYARRRRQPKSPLRILIGVVTSGLAGCLVTYYGLAFWLGPQFKSLGFPDLPLAGWVTTLRGADDAAGETPAFENHVKVKPASDKASPKAP